MKITLIQTDIAWADPAANASHIEKIMMSAPASDIYILPEMWSTGFQTQPDGSAEKEQSQSLQWMQRMANRLDAAVAGSIAVKDTADETYRNRFYFVRPQDEPTEEAQCEYYDKHHLFTYGGEHNHYTAGNKRTVCEWRGVRFLLLVCYDLRFPVWARNHEDYDCILCVASWPEPRINAWHTLLQARAIENQCYVAGVNRIGRDPYCKYIGGTQMIDPYGKILAAANPDTEMAVTSEIEMNGLRTFRKKFPVLKDRD